MAKTIINHHFKTLRKVKKIEIEGNALDIFKRRYVLKDKKGKLRETVRGAFYRVASFVADGEEEPELKKLYTDYFFRLLTSKRFIPNTPTWSGAKTKLGQLAGCFVLPVEDEMGREKGGIFQTLKNAALVQQTGGGVGFSFSRLRPKGDKVGSSNGVASGPVSFLEVYDAAFGQIAQGGTRRGANMAVLRVDHPDILSFIKCKSGEGKITNFNVSIGITDAFMEAVQKDEQFALINPRNGKIWKKVKAREIFETIVEYAHSNGEPGVLFLDAANRENPVPNQYILEATNPCGEQWLGPYENCCLGHVNINESVINGKMNWNHLKESVVLGTRFLDDIINQNGYVEVIPELKEMALKNRRIGLGFLGLADAMYQLGIRYGSRESLDFTSQIVEFMRYQSMLTSIDLAKEKGPFSGIKDSVYDPQNLQWRKPRSMVRYRLKLGRPSLDWPRIIRLLKKYGIRNSTQLTVAPTGTTGTVLGVEGYGCEPVFALAYSRRVYQSAGGEKDLELKYISPSFKKTLDKTKLTQKEKEAVFDYALEKGSIQAVKNLPEKIKNTFVVASDIEPKEHVLIQAAIQRFVDNSISKTCNFPAGASKEDVERVYFLAWKLGCKGVTVYVTGSREEIVLETKETADKKKAEEPQDLKIKSRPAVAPGKTYRVETPVGTAFVTVNANGASEPLEVFVNVGKAGSDIAADAEAMGRLISLNLRLRSNFSPQVIMTQVVDQLNGIGGGDSVGFGKNRVRSLADGIAKVLKEHLGGKEVAVGQVGEQPSLLARHQNRDLCPECGRASLVYDEGCTHCFLCGYEKC